MLGLRLPSRFKKRAESTFPRVSLSLLVRPEQIAPGRLRSMASATPSVSGHMATKESLCLWLI
jgi:hypothetical protein